MEGGEEEEELKRACNMVTLLMLGGAPSLGAMLRDWAVFMAVGFGFLHWRRVTSLSSSHSL